MGATPADIKSIFGHAMSLSSSQERAAYLQQACAGNPALLAEIESLLQADRQAGSFLGERDPRSVATIEDPIRERPGTVIGPYKLMEQIGEGGMGLVFVAEQQQPVRRKVALKVIKPGMDSRQVVARFEAERQALALMDHPHIARVLDGGTTDSSRPYFVMELVKGVPMTDYCDQNNLSIRERLELFVSVCQAVQHAHQKGIIHRDIKPSNILVVSHDGTPVVKVIDFGVSKAIGQQLTDKTIYTQFSQMIGTPLYMSPEQAGMSGLDVDTRSDIYSLGVLLYELLTGTTPFGQERMREVSYDEMRRIIREEEPPRPSTRISTLGKAAITVSTQRQSEPKKLSRLFRGELDWLVMKALEKDRNRRYETAGALAADVQRYLRDEPVLACPPSLGYRLRKLVRRHWRPAVAAVLVLLTLVGGIAGTTWGLLRAEAKKQEAVDERDAKELALQAEQQARADEKKAQQQAFAALRSMTADVVERKFTQGTVLTEDDRAFLRGVIAQYDAFAALKGNDADSRAVRAEGRWRVGNVRRRLGELREAKQDYDQALSIYTQLTADFPKSPVFRKGLADCHNHRGLLLKDTSRHKEAEKDFEQALKIREQLAADFPSQSDYRHDLAGSYSNRALLRNVMGWPRQAEKYFEQAVRLQKQLAADFPNRPEFRYDLAKSHTNRGSLRRSLRRYPEAEQDFNEAVRLQKQLAADFPHRPEYRHGLAGSYSNRSFVLSATGRRTEAKQDYDQALSIRKQLAADFPSRPAFRDELGASYLSRGMHLSATGQFKEAEQHYDQALSLFKQLAAEFPNRPEYRQELARSHLIRGMLRHRTGHPQEAEQEYDQVLSIKKQLAADFPSQPDPRNDLAITFVNLASIHARQGDWAAAKRLLLEGRPHHLAVLKANPNNPDYRQFYRNHLGVLTEVHAGLLEQQDAVRTAEICRDLGWNAPLDFYDAACSLSRCIPIAAKHDKLNEKQRKEAAQFYGEGAMKFLREAVSKGYKDKVHMKRDTDLDPLRQRGDFQKLMAGLEAKGK